MSEPKKERVMTIGINETKIPVTGEYDLSEMNLEVQRQREKYTKKL